MKIEAFLPEEEEAHYEDKDRLHVTDHLEGDSRESAYAYELTQVGPHGDSARQNYKHLQKSSKKMEQSEVHFGQA